MCKWIYFKIKIIVICFFVIEKYLKLSKYYKNFILSGIFFFVSWVLLCKMYIINILYVIIFNNK